MDLDESWQVANISYQEGSTLVFRDQPFIWEELYAAPGEYVVGFLVQDLDGKVYPVYENMIVE